MRKTSSKDYHISGNMLRTNDGKPLLNCHKIRMSCKFRKSFCYQESYRETSYRETSNLNQGPRTWCQRCWKLFLLSTETPNEDFVSWVSERTRVEIVQIILHEDKSVELSKY